MQLVEAIRTHVFAGERIHADDTTVRLLAKARPAPAGYGPMCATTSLLPALTRRRRCSSIRAIVAGAPQQHLAGFAGLMQADAYAGFNRSQDHSSRPPAGLMRGAGSST
jgi:transposase